jgi:hypothetical protein
MNEARITNSKNRLFHTLVLVISNNMDCSNVMMPKQRRSSFFVLFLLLLLLLLSLLVPSNDLPLLRVVDSVSVGVVDVDVDDDVDDDEADVLDPWRR